MSAKKKNKARARRRGSTAAPATGNPPDAIVNLAKALAAVRPPSAESDGRIDRLLPIVYSTVPGPRVNRLRDVPSGAEHRPPIPNRYIVRR